MKINKGNQRTTINGKQFNSIIDIIFDDKYEIYIFQGKLSKNDIIIKYRENGKRMRTPKHIHWAVDLLLKMQADKLLTKSFIKEIKKEWNDCKPLSNNDDNTLITLVDDKIEFFNIKDYEELDNYGEYNVEFLIVLMTLLMTQEKTNRNDAYMFGNVLNSLLKEDLDIFSIMSAAGFGGRN